MRQDRLNLVPASVVASGPTVTGPAAAVGLSDDVSHIYRAFFEDAPDAVVVVDENGAIIEANAQAGVLFGYEKDEFLGRPVEMLLPERFRALHRDHRAEFTANPGKRPMGAGLDLWGRRKNGSEFPVDVSLSPAATEAGSATLAAIRDVTIRRATEEALRVSEHRFRKVFEDAPFGMAIVDRDRRFRQVNDSLCGLLGHQREDLLARALHDLTPPEDVRTYERQLGRLFDGEIHTFAIEKRFVTRAGRVLWAKVTFAGLADGSDADLVAVAMIEDITDRKQAQARLTHLATHDELTGLANRSLLGDRIRQAQARSARSGQLLAVLFLDLDGFKRVNDDLGHDVGDELLARIGPRIAGAVRPADTCARHGGDEFVVCVEDLGRTEAEARAVVEGIVARLVERLDPPVALSVGSIPMTACIGAVLARGADATPATLIARADLAMYEAKRRGPGRSALAPGLLGSADGGVRIGEGAERVAAPGTGAGGRGVARVPVASGPGRDLRPYPAGRRAADDGVADGRGGTRRPGGAPAGGR